MGYGKYWNLMRPGDDVMMVYWAWAWALGLPGIFLNR